MGAADFHEQVPVEGRGLTEAFLTVRDGAAWEYGHGGYTGTIAEKGAVVEVKFPENLTAAEIMDAFYNCYSYSQNVNGVWQEIPAKRPDWASEVTPRWDHVVKVYNDKWGPAIGFRVDDEYHFVGWASS